jgi:hypothetical protein
VSCPYCTRTFPWASSLRRHVLTHTGQKCHKCPSCLMLFTAKSKCDCHLLCKPASPESQDGDSSPSSKTSPSSSLGNYTVRNVPERPYKCNYCPRSTFSTQSNLKKHMQAKHNPVSPGPVSQSLISRYVPKLHNLSSVTRYWFHTKLLTKTNSFGAQLKLIHILYLICDSHICNQNWKRIYFHWYSNTVMKFST